jgi:hypothetical protein
MPRIVVKKNKGLNGQNNIIPILFAQVNNYGRRILLTFHERALRACSPLID